MRTIETLARQYPDKTGKELLEIQQQDKIEDQKEFEELHQKKINFVNDIKKNGGYFKGTFGLDQRFMYHITDIRLDEKGKVYVDVENITIFLGHNRGVVKENDFSFEKRTDRYKDASTYGFGHYERIDEKEWNELIEYIRGVDKFWSKK